MPANKNQDNLTVSIICRSTGRAELQQALDSVAGQNYPALELVLVDALGSGLEAPPEIRSGIDKLQIVNRGQAMSRPVAANAGLDAASGQLLMFLDEDDWIANDHVANLVACLQANPDVQAAYSSTRKTDARGQELETVFREAYQPLLLMRDNYIPIHAMVFSAELIAKGCRFDEAFDIYEDWDFWLQLNQHTAFIHVDQITAFYRQGGGSDTATEDTANRYRQGHPLCEARARLFDKWLPQWQGQQVNALIGDMDKSQELAQLARLLDSEHQANLGHQEQIRQQLQELESLQHRLNISEQQRHEEHNAASEEISELKNHLQLIQNSLSWKISKPLRAVRRLWKKQ